MGSDHHHRNSGRRRQAGPHVRTEPVRVLFRPGEREDLEVIARAWGVPVASVAWALVSAELSRVRRRAPELGELGFAIVAAVRVLGGLPAVEALQAREGCDPGGAGDR